MDVSKLLWLYAWKSLLQGCVQGIFTNLAYKRKTHVSSGDGRKGVDGFMGTTWTALDHRAANEWLAVDLVKAYYIDYVLIYRMCPKCETSTDDSYIVGLAERFEAARPDPMRGESSECGRGQLEGRENASSAVKVVKIVCHGKALRVRFVTVRRGLEGSVKHLSLSEMEVYGDVEARLLNVAFQKPSYLGSSTSLAYWRSVGCVDEDPTTTCRSKHPDSWFLVDLVSQFCISRIRYTPELNYKGAWGNYLKYQLIRYD